MTEPTPNARAKDGGKSLADRIHDAHGVYRGLENDLFEAIEEIVGEDNLEDAHVECDSATDNSVEIVMAEGASLTSEHREKILALGFRRIWSDARSKRL